MNVSSAVLAATYYYTGGYFNNFDPTSPSNPFTTSNYEFLTLELSSALSAGSTTFCGGSITSCTNPATINITSFIYSDQHLAATIANASGYYFSLDVNSHNIVTKWDLYAATNVGGESISSCTLTNTLCYGYSAGASYPPQDQAQTGSAGSVYFGSYTGPGGCWGYGAACASSVQPTPIPGALPLFFTGLLSSMGLLGWRRKSRKVAIVVS